MKYLLLIYASEQKEAEMTEAEMGELMAGYQAFGEAAGAAGAMVDGERLRPVSTASTVRIRDGKATCTDGPFAETKEQLGGFYIVEAKDLDAALEWAKQIPSAAMGSVEVRPVWEMDASG